MTSPLTAYEGWYSMPGLSIAVRVLDGRLTVALPGVPPGFEIGLEPLEAPHAFRMQGGPMDGATAVFFPDEAGLIERIQVAGDHELQRTEPPADADVPAGHGLQAPPLVLDEAKTAAFDALIDEVLTAEDGRALDYRLPYPKHEFLQYAATQEKFIFHGSGKLDIDEFVTRRTSMELRDRTGRGNVQGIYGTHDGLWPLFFAVLDRARITGSIRNGFSTFHNHAGDEVKVYNFTINEEWLDKDPWRTGALYFLPREPFRRLPMSTEGSESNEWVSETALKPLARLIVEPEDFPFLDQVGGHDDSALLRFNALGRQIVGATLQLDGVGDELRIRLRYTPELGGLLLEYIQLAQDFVPTAAFKLHFLPDGETWLGIAAPPAVMQVLQSQVDAHLAA